MDLSDPAAQVGLHPELGILSRTLNSSPTVKWILPARIRSPTKNDVVFVGDTSIQLREFVTTGSTHLADASGKLDLQTQILAAKVVSAKLEPIPVLEAIENQSGDEERFTINNQPVKEGQPPQILVLSTASSHLIFVYAREHYDGSVRFVYARRPITWGLDSAERMGRYLAVDPESRALAVAPALRYFSLLSMRPVDEIKQQIDNWQPTDPSSFRPWHEQRVAQVDGFIVKVDFLHSPRDEQEKVILAMLVANQGQIFLLLYRWDTRMPLVRFKPMRCSGQPLPPEDGFPLMLIPCVSSLSFLLVTETCLVIYDQVTASEANTTRYSFKAPNTVKVNGVTRPKRWTQWARPNRHLQYRRMHDDIFLVREDGVIETCLIDFSNRKVKVTTSVTPGSLDMCVDGAFCLLEGPLHTGGGDIIIAGGDMTDGGLFHARARQPMERIQTLSNGAPFSDLVLLDSRKSAGKGLHYTSTTDIFACCGNTENRGAIAQIQHGLEAQVGWTVDHPDVTSIERLWTLEVRSRETLLLMSSHTSHTSILILGLDEVDLEFADSITFPGLEFQQTTLAASMLDGDLLIQITPDSLIILPMTDQPKALRVPIDYLQPLCADVLPEMNFIAIAHRSGEAYGLSLCRISTDSTQQYEAGAMQEVAQFKTRPLCVQQATVSGTSLVLVGTEQGEIHALAVDPGVGVRSLLHINVQKIVAGLDGIAVSSICILAHKVSKCGLVLCGLRGGALICVEVRAQIEDGKPVLVPKLLGAYNLGSTTTRVSPDLHSSVAGATTSAFALCRSVLKRVSISEHTEIVDYQIDEVCITTRNDTSRPQPCCNLVHRIQSLQSRDGSETSGLLICVTPNDLFFSSLAPQRQAVIRHFSVPGIPKKVLYSKYLNRLVTGIEASVDNKGEIPTEDTRTPQLYFMTANPNEPENLEIGRSQQIIVGDSGERIKALIEYCPSDDRKRFHYEMVVIALTKDIHEPHRIAKPMSRVMALSLKHIMKGNIAAAKAKLVMSLPGKLVTALCPMGLSSLLIGAGNEIILHSLDVETKKWTTMARFTLPSPTPSIHVEGSLIFIACVKHSLLILHLSGNKLQLHASDLGAKLTNNVVSFDNLKAIVTSITDKGTDLIGFAEDRFSNGYRQVFDGNVPLMIDRLQQHRIGDSAKGRTSFIGNTTDGTLYSFMTINPEEWALLHFIQGLWLYEKDLPPLPRKHTARRSSHGADRWSRVPTPEQMHINGDILACMLEPGHATLRDLLETRVKIENECSRGADTRARLQTLKELAEPILGSSHDDIIGAVSTWMRKLM